MLAHAEPAATVLVPALPGGGAAACRRAHLARANLGLEKLRVLLRLAIELKLLDLRRYEHAARSIDEVGRLVGGWAGATMILCC